MKERIQKIIAARGLMSRRAAEELLREGHIKINGQTARLGDSADASADSIQIDGTPLPPPPKSVCLLLHKPRGYITTMSDERGRKTVASLVDCGCRVYPVGRLDYQSEGLLLMTNDGALANRLMHPSNEIEKVYDVTVRGEPDDGDVRLSCPIELDGRRIRPPLVTLLRAGNGKTTYRITIHEGRNRQIRRMCEAAGLTVLRLCRVREGTLELGDLPCGKWRYLTEKELAALMAEMGEKA